MELTVPIHAIVRLCLLATICQMAIAVRFGRKLSEQSRNGKDSPTPGLPEMDYDARLLVTTKGYPFEEHSVVTDDNYILKIHRIPHGVKGAETAARPPVFLQHGLLSSSDQWLLNLQNESLAYILADSGYDVWLGNVRGNVYSRNNTQLKPEDAKFWDFSFHEMSTHDLPAMLDYVFQATGKQKIRYVGHSQGTLIAFLQFSKNSEWSQERIAQFHALAPVAYLKTISSPLRFIAPLTNFVQFLFKLIGEKEFMPNNNFLHWFADNACSETGLEQKLCDHFIFFFKQGFSKESANMTRMPVYASHDPAGTSSKNMVHYGQMVAAKKLQQYDYGKKKNNEIYGQNSPPEYNLKQIKVPTAFYWGAKDVLADTEDVKLLYAEIKESVFANTGYPSYRHLDFSLGLNAAYDVYPKMMKLMQR